MGKWAGGVRGAEDWLVTPPSVGNACLPESLFDVSGYYRTVGTQAGTAEALIVEQSRKAGLWFPPASSEPSVSNRWFALPATKLPIFRQIRAPRHFLTLTHPLGFSILTYCQEGDPVGGERLGKQCDVTRQPSFLLACHW